MTFYCDFILLYYIAVCIFNDLYNKHKNQWGTNSVLSNGLYRGALSKHIHSINELHKFFCFDCRSNTDELSVNSNMLGIIFFIDIFASLVISRNPNR